MEKVLNLSFYSGEDSYSDGEIEDKLLEIVKNNDDYYDILCDNDDWTYLYHLSPIRENILEWFDFDKNGSVLEIGSGCGAITGLLCQKVSRVVGIDLSKKRSLINAYKNKEYSNLEIYVGNFKDISIDEKFDYVTLIGVLEYSGYYIGGNEPFSEMLKRAGEYLKPGGVLITAIENKYGMKYFAGAREDHTGNIYDGIMGYQGVDRVKTFSKNALEDMLINSGFSENSFYYPMPDYKMPTEIYSAKRLPKAGALRGITQAYDRDRYVFFDEELAFDSVCEDNMFEFFANSFLVFSKK